MSALFENRISAVAVLSDVVAVPVAASSLPAGVEDLPTVVRTIGFEHDAGLPSGMPPRFTSAPIGLPGESPAVSGAAEQSSLNPAARLIQDPGPGGVPSAATAGEAELAAGHSAADIWAMTGMPLSSGGSPVQSPIITAQPVMQQVADTIVAQVVHTDIGEIVTLDAVLEPPELGRLHVRLSRSESGLTAVVSAERGDVHQIIADHAASIEQTLRTHLPATERVLFSAGQTPFAEGGSTGGGEHAPEPVDIPHSSSRNGNATPASARTRRIPHADVDVLA